MNKELIEQLRNPTSPDADVSLMDDAADLIEAQQKRIDELTCLVGDNERRWASELNERVYSLAASQAQIKVLREALYDQLNDCINFNGGELTICIMEQSTKVLEQPTDDSALRELLKAERERVAQKLLKLGALGDGDYIAAIRAMENK